MSQAVETKYSPGSDGGGAISVRCQAKRKRVAWDHALDIEANHREAAMALIRELGWESYGSWVGGSKADDTGYVFVLVSVPTEIAEAARRVTTMGTAERRRPSDEEKVAWYVRELAGGAP